MFNVAAKHPQGLKYHDFVAKRGSEEHRRRWRAVYEKVSLKPPQRELLAGFVRKMKVLCLAGAWCGDCVNQCPIFQRFAEAAPRIDLRFFDRDLHADFQPDLQLCGGDRVPLLVILNKEDNFCGVYGDRTLSKYRQMAVDQLGPSCPTGIAPPDQELLKAVTQEWLAEFERVQLMLRLSAYLRRVHGD